MALFTFSSSMMVLIFSICSGAKCERSAFRCRDFDPHCGQILMCLLNCFDEFAQVVVPDSNNEHVIGQSSGDDIVATHYLDPRSHDEGDEHQGQWAPLW